MNKEVWLRWAELIDSYRIFPRLVLIGYGYYVYQVTFFVLEWYSRQPASARGTEESVVVGVVVTAVTGFAPMIYRIYADTSRDWNSQQPMTTLSRSTTITTAGKSSDST